MGQRLRDVSLENLAEAPAAVLDTVFWELTGDPEGVDQRLHKEEWFSSTLLEWGVCGKLAYAEDDDPVGFVQFAPPSLFPRLADFPAGRVSEDAIYLGYCYVTPGHRGRGVGSELVRATARDLVERGYRALEAVGQIEWAGGWILPSAFLAKNRFAVIREDPNAPLWRLDLLSAHPAREEAAAAATLPQP